MPIKRTYELTWVPEMGIFHLKRVEDAKSRPVTEDDLRKAFAGNVSAHQWMDEAKANPGTPLVWG